MVFERVRLIGDREMDHWPAYAPALVEVVLKDGRRFSERVDWAKGRRENPMTRGELERKFLDLAITRISRDQANQLMDRVYGLDQVPNVREIAELLRAYQTMREATCRLPWAPAARSTR
jgi:2-methylcitrate dehydratase